MSLKYLGKTFEFCEIQFNKQEDECTFKRGFCSLTETTFGCMYIGLPAKWEFRKTQM